MLNPLPEPMRKCHVISGFWHAWSVMFESNVSHGISKDCYYIFFCAFILSICELARLYYEKFEYYIWLLSLEKLLTWLLWRVQSFLNTGHASI